MLVTTNVGSSDSKSHMLCVDDILVNIEIRQRAHSQVHVMFSYDWLKTIPVNTYFCTY